MLLSDQGQTLTFQGFDISRLLSHFPTLAFHMLKDISHAQSKLIFQNRPICVCKRCRLKKPRAVDSFYAINARSTNSEHRGTNAL